MGDNEYHPHGGPSRVALMRRNGELRVELEAAEAEVRVLREQLAAALEGLHAIAEPDALLDANEDAFNEHAARWMKAQAQVVIRAATADPTPQTETP